MHCRLLFCPLSSQHRCELEKIKWMDCYLLQLLGYFRFLASKQVNSLLLVLKVEVEPKQCGTLRMPVSFTTMNVYLSY